MNSQSVIIEMDAIKLYSHDRGIDFRADAKSYLVLKYEHLRDQRRAASLRYRNRAAIAFEMCEQKSYLVWFSCPRRSYPVKCEHGLDNTVLWCCSRWL